MALVVKDRVKETTTTTGTGSVTLAGAATGFQTFNSAISVGNTTYYCIAGQGTSEWEVGVGTLSASTTLARTTVLSSSNSGSLVTFSAGTKDVFVTYPSALAANISNKNALINGDFQVWQEGTSFAAMAASTYVADLWTYWKSGAMVHTGSQSSDVPTIAQAGRKIPYSLLIDCTTVDASIAAGDYCLVRTYIEGYNFVNIAGVGLCHQFWHKHTKTGTYCVGYMNSGTDRTFVREYTQAVSDTWELATVLIDASPTAGTWNYTNGLGLQISFALASGSTYQTTAGAWQTGGFLATSNQVNACDSTSNNFMLAGVQLEKGSVATEFDVRTFQDELSLCLRYFQKSFTYSTAPAQSVGTTTGELYGISGFAAGASTSYLWTRLPVAMRATPTCVTFNPVTTDNQVTDESGSLACTSTSAIPRTDSLIVTCIGNAGTGVGNLLGVHYTLNARF